MLHHAQLGIYEQARCLFHKNIEFLLWNGPSSPFLRMVQDLNYNPYKRPKTRFLEVVSLIIFGLVRKGTRSRSHLDLYRRKMPYHRGVRECG